MTEARLKTEVWVQAVLRQGNGSGRFGVVARRGDADAGGVLVELRRPDGGLFVLSQTRGPGGELAWLRVTGAAPVDQATADAYVARRLKVDPDLWIIEFESPDGLPPFEANII
jgi:hypothetical protein